MAPSPQNPPPLQQQLQQLHDIHLPDEIGSWPPAIGWWLLVIITVALGTALAIYGIKKFRSLAPRRQALKELKTLQTNYSANQSQITLRLLSELLKRVALSYHPRHQVAKLSDQAWLKFLDQTGSNVDFESGPANALVKHRYQPSSTQSAPVAIDEIFDTCKQWIKSQQ